MMNTLQLKQVRKAKLNMFTMIGMFTIAALLFKMSGYRREDLLDDDSNDGANIVFSSNLTSISNPRFSSSHQLVLDDSQPPEVPLNSIEQQHNSGQRDFSISFITSNVYDRKRVAWSRLTQFEKLLSLVVVLLGLVIFTLSLILLIQPRRLLQVHLSKDEQGSEIINLLPQFVRLMILFQVYLVLLRNVFLLPAQLLTRLTPQLNHAMIFINFLVEVG